MLKLFIFSVIAIIAFFIVRSERKEHKKFVNDDTPIEFVDVLFDMAFSSVVAFFFVIAASLLYSVIDWLLK